VCLHGWKERNVAGASVSWLLAYRSKYISQNEISIYIYIGARYRYDCRQAAAQICAYSKRHYTICGYESCLVSCVLVLAVNPLVN
jgi:hypothetical protein